MSNAANAAITYRSQGGFAVGTTVDHITVTLTAQGTPSNSASQNVAPLASSASFTGLNPDTYIPSAQAFDQSGNALAAAVTGAAVTVQGTQQTVALEVPQTISATAA